MNKESSKNLHNEKQIIKTRKKLFHVYSSKRQWGVCKQMKLCANRSLIYWPKDDQCYQKFSRGPCAKGQLLAMDLDTGIPVCKCNDHKELNDYRYKF